MVVTTCKRRKSFLQAKVERDFKSDKHPPGARSVVSGVCECVYTGCVCVSVFILDVCVFVNVCVGLCVPPDLTTERLHKHSQPGLSHSTSYLAGRSVGEQPGCKTHFFVHQPNG